MRWKLETKKCGWTARRAIKKPDRSQESTYAWSSTEVLSERVPMRPRTRPAESRSTHPAIPAYLAGVTGLQQAVAEGLMLKGPIRLSPAKPFIAGKAALVFVSPHVLDAGQDFAEFGSLVSVQWTDTEWFLIPEPPHDGARVVAWFRPPVANEKYLADFACAGGSAEKYQEPIFNEDEQADKFTLVASSGGSSSAPWLEGEQHVAMVFEVSTTDWLSLALNGSDHWRLLYCEISRLAKP
jgi:hypothetical protein